MKLQPALDTSLCNVYTYAFKSRFLEPNVTLASIRPFCVFTGRICRAGVHIFFRAFVNIE